MHLLSFDQDVSGIICWLMVKCRRVFDMWGPHCFRLTDFHCVLEYWKEKLKSRKFSLAPKKKQHERNECTSTVYNFRTVSFLSKIVSTSFQWQHLSQMEGRCLRKTNPTLTLYPEPHDVTLPTWQALPTTHQPWSYQTIFQEIENSHTNRKAISVNFRSLHYYSIQATWVKVIQGFAWRCAKITVLFTTES